MKSIMGDYKQITFGRWEDERNIPKEENSPILGD